MSDNLGEAAKMAGGCGLSMDPRIFSKVTYDSQNAWRSSFGGVGGVFWYVETGDRAEHHSQGVLEQTDSTQEPRNTPAKCLKETFQSQNRGVPGCHRPQGQA